MKLTLQALMSLVLMIACVYGVITATKWPMKTALFPIVVEIPVFFMALAVFVQEQMGKRTEKCASGDSAVDFKLSRVRTRRWRISEPSILSSGCWGFLFLSFLSVFL